MYTKAQEIAGMEHQIEEGKKTIEFSQRVEKLLNNPDFRAIILDGYCVKEAARFVRASVSMAIDAEGRKASLEMAQATGHLLNWLQKTQMDAENVASRMAEMEEELVLLRAEQDSEED